MKKTILWLVLFASIIAIVVIFLPSCNPAYYPCPPNDRYFFY